MTVLDTQRGPVTAGLAGELYEGHTAESAWTESVKQAVGVLAALVVITSFIPPSIQPSIEHDFADPTVLAAGNGYYAYSTQSQYGDHFWHVPVQRAHTLHGEWAAQGDALPQLPDWVAKDANGQAAVWAPEVTAGRDGAFLLYFTAPASAAARCIGAALSRSPTGPFAPQPHPLVCQPENNDTIDPATFTDTDGSRFLLYANGRAATTIWLQQLAPDGLSTVGSPLALIHADRPEEASVVEAPTLTYRDGRYVLFYSANTFNSGHYFVNYATSRSLSIPFHKHPGPLVAAPNLTDGFTNPGGQDLMPSRDPNYLVFHAFTGVNRRSMFIVPLIWSENGTPTVHLPTPAQSRTSQPAPSAGLILDPGVNK